MQGRLENDIKIEKTILKMLEELPDYVTDWYYNLKASSKTAQSCKDYISKIRKFLSFIDPNYKNIDPQKITLQLVQKYIVSIQTKKNKSGEVVYTSDSYQQTIWCCLNNFFNYLEKIKLIEYNYMTTIGKPSNHDLERINENRILLTEKDFKKIINVVKNGTGSHKAKAFQNRMKNRDILIISMFMNTGMRKTALSEINVDDIDFDNYKLCVKDKGDKTHIYDIGDDMMDLIEEWLYDREDILGDKESDALFITDECARLSSSAIYKLVDKYCFGALGYHISPHKLRSGVCSILYQKTNNVEFVRRAIGHSNVATTQRYIVTENTEKKQASEILGKIIF